jgi:hypothetical protein
LLPQITRAGHWLLESGIQEPNGGFARYYRTDLRSNQAISTEITGYGISTLVYLHSLTHDERYLENAAAAARFLTRTAWDATAQTMPFETHPAAPSLFFDCGIVVRGLLAAWRALGDEEFLAAAVALGRGMARDFASVPGEFHPAISLPHKRPLERDPLRWSKNIGCYQLKAAMAWGDLAEAAGDDALREPYEQVLEMALRTSGEFLPGNPERARVMDRLHAYLYFLEGLLPHAAEKRCAAVLREGICRVAVLLREIAPEFERSDVYAQLLRIRLYADAAGSVPLDRAAAQCEAARLTELQSTDEDPRAAGGFHFGRQGGELMPYVNPWSTGFALQALALWSGGQVPVRHLLI